MATKPARLTALGDFIGIYPVGEIWHVVAFNHMGRWKAAHRCHSRAEAIRSRSDWFRLHERLAKEREARRRK